MLSVAPILECTHFARIICPKKQKQATIGSRFLAFILSLASREIILEVQNRESLGK